MRTFLRHFCLLSFSAVLSWWAFLYQPQESSAMEVEAEPFVMALLPNTVVQEAEEMPAANSKESTPSPAAQDPLIPAEASHVEEANSMASAPPPPEAGRPEGEEDVETQKEVADLDAESSDAVESVMENPTLLAAAEKELSGEVRKGFHSVFLASAEDQVRIGQYFGERMVLVPKSALDPSNANPYFFEVSFREDNPQVIRVAERPPLEQFRQYRDLFGYPYNDLPDVLRELRRSVLARNEVFLFGVLIPSREWALAIDRRSRALNESGREIASVQKFVLRYVLTTDGGYDIEISSIQFADGTTYQPSPKHP